MKQCLFFVLFLSCCMAMPAFAVKPLETIKNVTLVKGDPRNDGDSFMVRTPKGEELHLRLYHVDCPEAYAGINVEQIREQRAYFGLENLRDVVRFGKQATEYVEQVLSRPFTVRTVYARALGRSVTSRFYVFVETHDGRDLGHLLVEQGLARVFGKPHRAPDGTPSGEVRAELKDIRWVAMLNNAGIWGATKPRPLLDGHKFLREKEQKRREGEEELKPACDFPLDLNTASQECLQELCGIGQVKADKIIAGRPYQSIDDLLDAGITRKTLEDIRPRVTVGTEPSNSTAQPE